MGLGERVSQNWSEKQRRCSSVLHIRSLTDDSLIILLIYRYFSVSTQIHHLKSELWTLIVRMRFKQFHWIESPHQFIALTDNEDPLPLGLQDKHRGKHTGWFCWYSWAVHPIFLAGIPASASTTNSPQTRGTLTFSSSLTSMSLLTPSTTQFYLSHLKSSLIITGTGTALYWLRTYFTNGKQFVNINDCASSTAPLSQASRRVRYLVLHYLSSRCSLLVTSYVLVI